MIVKFYNALLMLYIVTNMYQEIRLKKTAIGIIVVFPRLIIGI